MICATICPGVALGSGKIDKSVLQRVQKADM